MNFFKKIKEDYFYNRDNNTVVWRRLKWSLLLLVIGVTYAVYVRLNDTGPWYLGCATSNGKELLLKTDKKPRVKGGLVFLGDDIFVTPEPGMTCRIVTVRKAEEEQESRKPLDNEI